MSNFGSSWDGMRRPESPDATTISMGLAATTRAWACTALKVRESRLSIVRHADGRTDILLVFPACNLTMTVRELVKLRALGKEGGGILRTLAASATVPATGFVVSVQGG